MAISTGADTITTATSLTDAAGHAWTLGAGGALLRDGADTGGRAELLSVRGGVAYARLTDEAGVTWFVWDGQQWQNVGRAEPTGNRAVDLIQRAAGTAEAAWAALQDPALSALIDPQPQTAGGPTPKAVGDGVAKVYVVSAGTYLMQALEQLAAAAFHAGQAG